MAIKKKECDPNKIYEFNPQINITNIEIIELANLIRIGIPGDVLANASENLKKHFRTNNSEVKPKVKIGRAHV